MNNKRFTNPEAPGIIAKNAFTVDGNTVSVQLAQGQVALIDLSDLPLVAAHRWYASRSGNTYYAKAAIRVNGKQKRLRLHRFLQETSPDRPFVDHVNRDGLDNRKANLRPCSFAENCCNRSCQRGSSEYRGVVWHKRDGKWYAEIRQNGKTKHLGCFASDLDAALAYDRAAREMFGDFASLNFPETVQGAA